MFRHMDTRAEEHSGKSARSLSDYLWKAPVKHRKAIGSGPTLNEAGCKPVLASPVQQQWQLMWFPFFPSPMGMAALVMVTKAVVVEAAAMVMVQAETGAAHWDVLIRARAIETQCYLLAADAEAFLNVPPLTWNDHATLLSNHQLNELDRKSVV